MVKKNKGKVLPVLNRKRALYSCDRCRLKKRACRRDGAELDSCEQPCNECLRAGAICKTSRKKTFKNTLEKTAMHYKCLLKLVKGLYPHENIEDLDYLIKFGENMGIEMPIKEQLTSSDVSSMAEASKIISRDSSDCFLSVHDNTASSPSKDSDAKEPDDTRAFKEGFHTFPFGSYKEVKTEKDIYIVDRRKNLHFIGPYGAPSVLLNTINCMKRREASARAGEPWTKSNDFIGNKIPICSEKAAYDFNNGYFYSTALPLNRKVANQLVDTFLKKVHPFCRCFREKDLIGLNNVLWDNYGTGSKTEFTISKIQAFSVYLVWMLGAVTDPYMEDSSIHPKDLLVLVDEIKSSLQNLILVPTLLGVRCLYLLALYTDFCESGETAFILLQICMDQARSIGLARSSLSSYLHDKSEFADAQLIWWALFEKTMHFSNRIGRAISISKSEITTNISMDFLPEAEISLEMMQKSIMLDRAFHCVVEDRRHILTPSYLLHSSSIDVSMNTVLNLKNIYKDFHSSHFIEKTPTDHFVVALKYYYYVISASLPILSVYVDNMKYIRESDELFDLIFEGLRAAMSFTEIVKNNQDHTLVNNLSPINFVIYYAVLTLARGIILLKDGQLEGTAMISKYQKTFEIDSQNLNCCVSDLRAVNSKYARRLTGGYLAINRITELILNYANDITYVQPSLDSFDLDLFMSDSLLFDLFPNSLSTDIGFYDKDPLK